MKMPRWRMPSFRRILLVVLLLEGALALGVWIYLARTGKVLLVEMATRAEIAAEDGGGGLLLIPVAGVRPSELRDTYGASRSGGRSHEGIDIFAPDGTPVLAAADGVIVGRQTSALGGIALYLRDLDERTIYFYGHLQGYRAGLKEGDLVRRGATLGYVGHTGNAQATSPHLHFSIHTVTDPNRWWRGRTLPPCELLPCPPPPSAGKR